MARILEKFFDRSIQLGPRLVVAFTFLPCGLVMGYTFAAFVLERNNCDAIRYGPFILGITVALAASIGLLIVKKVKQKVIFCHLDILLAAGCFHLLGSGFYFAEKFDVVGAFISFVGHALTFVAALSYLHVVSPKNTRSLILSLCFTWYLLGIAAALSIISHTNNKNKESTEQEWVYLSFAWLLLPVSLLALIMLILIRVFYLLGNIDYKTCFDNDIRIANSNGSLFDSREEVIKRVHFFYVTKGKQWLVSFILIFVDAIHYSLFVYFMFWFALNEAVRISKGNSLSVMMWTAFVGAVAGNIGIFFFSIKVIFVTSSIAQISLTIIGMISYSAAGTLIPFWFLCFLFGVTICNIKISILETSNFVFTEILTFFSYMLKLLAIGIVYFYFVDDRTNSFFYSVDQSTLMAHGCVFLVVTSLITIIVSLEIPRTYNRSLFEIQYTLLGIVFEKHQLEQLNVRYLNDGTIPTVMRNGNA